MYVMVLIAITGVPVLQHAHVLTWYVGDFDLEFFDRYTTQNIFVNGIGIIFHTVSCYD